MRIPSGSTDRYVYFVAVDATDFTTRLPGLTDGSPVADFTVYRSRNGAAASAMTTPTINEVDSTNMPGVYELLLDEDTTISSANDTEEMVLHITQETMAPVTRTVELYRPKITEGRTLTVNTDNDLVDISDRINNLAIGSAAVSTVVDTYVLTTGTQSSGTFADTETRNGVYHQHTDSAGALDLYYEFDIGGGASATSFTLYARLNSANDSLQVLAYNWDGAVWEQINTLNGAAAFSEFIYNATVAHTGTGANAGKVRLRFYAASGLTTAELFVDQLVVNYTNTNRTVGYSNGAIWLDSTVSNTNSEPFVDGVSDNPVSTLNAANSLSASVNIRRFEVAPGSSFTFAASETNITYIGDKWTLNTGGQDISNTFISGANISGTAVAPTGGPTLVECILQTCTLPPCLVEYSGLQGTVTLGSAGDFFFISCHSNLAGTSTPVIDFNAAVGACNVSIRRYSGGIEIQNMQAGDQISIEGDGQIVVNANCTGGTITYRGIFRLTDNSSGAVEIIAVTPVAEQIRQDRAQGGTVNTITLDTGASSTDNFYDPGRVFILAGTGAGQVRRILDYNGTTKVATVDKNWRETPDATSSFIVFSDRGEGHVNEGRAQAATANTLQLNSFASSVDDFYIGQTLLVFSGTGAGQARVITDYNGSTKTATVDRNWQTTPDSASGYIIWPQVSHGDYVVNNINDILTTQMTESYAADGVAPTLAQAIFLIQQKLGDFAISGSTITVRQLDGAAVAATYTLDDDTNPTSSTRTS